jgi:hypothetical protein
MYRFFGRLGAAALLMLALATTSVLSQGTKEEKVTLDKVPKKVIDAVKSWFAEPEFSSMTKETTGDKVIYDLEFKHKGRKYEMDIKEDGTVLEIEKEVKGADIPKAVSDALKAKYAQATVKDVMEVNLVTGKNLKLDHYEATLETGGKTVEVLVTPDGKIKTEEKSEKK